MLCWRISNKENLQKNQFHCSARMTRLRLMGNPPTYCLIAHYSFTQKMETEFLEALWNMLMSEGHKVLIFQSLRKLPPFARRSFR